jgi:predicted nucleic acid-binding protein
VSGMGSPAQQRLSKKFFDPFFNWKHSVLGVEVHDARLAATMNVHGVGQILTFNTDDFTRYGVGVLHPSSIGV